MKTQYYTATSLDGYIATEDNSLEWLFPLGDVNDSSYPAFIAEVVVLAMGSSTYEWMLQPRCDRHGRDGITAALCAAHVDFLHTKTPGYCGRTLDQESDCMMSYLPVVSA